jgi:hypothetical protein
MYALYLNTNFNWMPESTEKARKNFFGGIVNFEMIPSFLVDEVVLK